jgi:hypothetical protein
MPPSAKKTSFAELGVKDIIRLTMPLAAGTKLDGHEILDLLGAGGMGEVYRARDVVLKRDVAIKVLPCFVSGIPTDSIALSRKRRRLPLSTIPTYLPSTSSTFSTAPPTLCPSCSKVVPSVRCCNADRRRFPCSGVFQKNLRDSSWLFATQRDAWVNARSAACRDIAGDESDRSQKRWNSDKGKEVVGCDTEE